MKNEWLPENFPRFNLCFLNDKFILINIPKNASTSVRNALSLHRREPFSNETKNSGHKKIVVIRDPVKRVVSSYMELIKLRKDGPHLETSGSEWFKLHQTNSEKSFKLFIDYIEDRLYDSHIHTQCDYINKKGLSIEDMDYILLFEYLDRDFNDMCGDLGINKKLKWDNKSKLNVIKNKIKKLVKEDVGLIDKIKKIYSEDFTLYNKVKKMKSNGNSSNRS
jgi:hypothetical protein|tara:strand:+ start:393 stop:1055 length:663 start_codon:yes stop_codon:yes gene_type:complete